MRNFSRSLLLTGALAFTGVLAGCGDDVTVAPPANDVVITGAPTAAIKVGDKVQLSASGATVSWASSNAAVASVDAASGLVTGVSAGTASITATSTTDSKKTASVSITVSGKGVRSVVVNPPNASLFPSGTLQAGVTVDADAGVDRGVDWSTSDATVATVSTTGVITVAATGSAGKSATITAKSKADPTVFGTLALTVLAPRPATVTISSITQQGGGGTVNVNNVAGAIDVNVNFTQGDQPIQKIEVLLDGNVVCSQVVSGAVEIEQALAANDQADIISCQINTAEFNTTTGVAKLFNGAHALSARAILQGGTQTATPSTSLVFNNASGFVVSLTNANTVGGPNSAVNPNNGVSFTQGTHTLKATGVSYVQGQTFNSVTVTFLGKTVTKTVTGGSQTFTVILDGTEGCTDTAADDCIDDYQTVAVGGDSPVISASVFSNGTAGPSGGSAMLNGTNAAVPAVVVARVDNVEPGVAGGGAAAVIGAAPLWVNSSFQFTSNGTAAPTGTGVTAATDGGVDNVTAAFFQIAGALPTTGFTQAPGQSCETTGMTAITNGSQLAETIVSTTYRARVVMKDALGNRVCFDVGAAGGTTFGADFVAPTVTATAGPANNSFFAATPVTALSFTVTDNASGFGATPVTITSTRTNPAGTTTCVFGTGGTCLAGTLQALTFDPTAGSNGEGYYAQTTTVSDQALNSTAATSTTFLVDVTAPAFSGGISLPPLIAGAQTNTFNATVTDNLDLNTIFGVVTYATGNLQYQTQSIGTYGTPLEKSSAVGYAAANWIRCLNAAGAFATAANPPSAITLSVTDQANNTTALASPAFGANAQACTGSVGNIASTDINSFTQSAPSYGTGKTQVDLDGASLAAASSATVVLSTVADVAVNTSVNPFTRVDFYRQSGANWILIGSSTAVLAQTPTTRTWTYSFTWDPAAPVAAGAVTVAAIGVDAEGDGVFTGTQVVTIVP